MQLRVVCAASDADGVLALLAERPGVAHVARSAGSAVAPAGDPGGDVVEAVVDPEVAQEVVHHLVDRGIARRGAISLAPLDLVVSETADAAGRALPGGGDADALIWEELLETTGEESELTPTFLAFLVIACLLAAVGVVTDSTVTIVGAMVVSPDFGPLAALAVAVVGRQRALAARAAVTLAVGFPVAILVTVAFTGVTRAVGLLGAGGVPELGDVAFVYEVGPASVAVALLAGVAGMLALTSRKSGALVGVFISVMTIPAAGFAAVAAVYGEWTRSGEAMLQLLVNLVAITAAGVLALRFRRKHVGRGQLTSLLSGRRRG